MGAWICKRAPPMRVIFMGLDAAGKTTVLYQMKLGEVVTTVPTIGFNVETVQVSGFEVTCWDVGGRDKIRPLYRHYMTGASGCVFVVDSNDRERLDDALDELYRYVLTEDALRDTVCMVLANKQDIEGAMTAQEIEDALRKKVEECGNVSPAIFVLPVCATTGSGLTEAFQCFVEQVRLKVPGDSKQGVISLEAAKPQKEEEQTSNPGKDVGAGGFAKTLVKDPVKYLKSLLFY